MLQEGQTTADAVSVESLRSKLPGKSRTGRFGAAVLMAAAIVAGAAATVEAVSVDRVDAIWAVNDEVGEFSQAIPIRAVHPGCPSWSRLGGLVIDSVETDESVTITATFPEHGVQVPCIRRGTAMRATVELDRPLGDRVVIDGGTGLDPATPITIAFYTGQSPGSPG